MNLENPCTILYGFRVEPLQGGYGEKSIHTGTMRTDNMTSSSEAKIASPERIGRLFIIGLIAVVVLGAAVWFILTQSFTSWDFRNNLWGPTHLLLTGRSPYIISQLFTGSNSVWLPTSIGAYLPLGLLPEAQATNLWAVMNIVLYGVVIWLSTHQRRPALIWLSLAGIGLYIFPSFVSLVTLGQFGVLATFLMLLAARQSEINRPILVGLLVALATAKPQLIVLPVLGLLLAFWKHGRGSAARFIVATAIWCAVMTLPLWLFYSDWIPGLRAALGSNPPWHQPSAFVLLPHHLGAAGAIIYGLLALGAFAANWRVWQIMPPSRAVAWSLALNLLITPYAWSWDFVLLVPLIVQLLFALKNGWLKLIYLAGYGVCVYLMIALRFSSDNSDWLFWWVPWLLMAGIGVMASINRTDAINNRQSNLS